MSQQLTSFDPQMLLMDKEEKINEEDSMNDDDNTTTINMESYGVKNDEYNINENDEYDDDGNSSVREHDEKEEQEEPEQEEKEEKQKWSGTPQELDDEIKKLKKMLNDQKKETETVRQKYKHEKTKSVALNAKVEELSKISSDDRNIVKQLEEYEQQKKEYEQKELELAYLQGEQKRMQIAYDMAKSSSAQYRNEKKELSIKIKELEQKLNETENEKSNDELSLAYFKAQKQRQDVRVESQANTIKRLKETNQSDATMKQLENAKNKLRDLEEKANLAENKELELAFYKAEKQRMEVQLEVQTSSIKQVKELNKELKKAVKHEQEERKSFERRMSQQFGVDDIRQLHDLSQLHDIAEERAKRSGDNDSQASSQLSGSQTIEQMQNEWQHEVDKLKYKLADERYEKLQLEKERKNLVHRLSTAENTHVNKLIQYTAGQPVHSPHNLHDDSFDEPPPPPPDKQQQHQQDEDNQDYDDDDDNDIDHDNDNDREYEEDGYEDNDEEEEDDDDDDEEDGHNPLNQIEALKFKLAEKELQNAQLKRRVSIAGIEKETLSLLWDSPRVTIQMVSEFIERLPLKHKEKIWARHATGQYIAKNKILHTLHSFVALCIKIKDRTAVAPSRHDIEKKLVPFAEIIRQRTENANGMSLDEFNNELHYWILEPVSGLIMTNDEQRQWMEELDALREELVKVNKEKIRIQRKSQMDLTVLLDKMKNLDSNEDDKMKEFEIQIIDYQEKIDKFQNDIRELKNTLSDQSNLLQEKVQFIAKQNQQLNEMNQENQKLKQKNLGKTRESEDEEEEEEDEYDNNIPNLIDESQIKPIDDQYHQLKNETEFEEERLEFYQNDQNIVKNQSYIGWKNKADKYKLEAETAKKDRKQSVETIERYKQQVHQLQNQNVSSVEQNQNKDTQINGLKTELNKWQKKHQQSEKIRKDSISTLHDNLFAKLLEAEAEHEEMVADYNKKIAKLQRSNEEIENNMSEMAKTKVNTIEQLANTVQTLREHVSVLSKETDRLNNKNKSLQERLNAGIFSNWLG